MASATPFSRSKDVGTAWTDVLSTADQTSSYRAFDRFTLTAQNDDPGGSVDFRVVAKMRGEGDDTDSREVIVKEAVNHTSATEPMMLISAFEATEYVVQARAGSGTRTVSAHIYIYDEAGRDN